MDQCPISAFICKWNGNEKTDSVSAALYLTEFPQAPPKIDTVTLEEE